MTAPSLTHLPIIITNVLQSEVVLKTDKIFLIDEVDVIVMFLTVNLVKMLSSVPRNTKHKHSIFKTWNEKIRLAFIY